MKRFIFAAAVMFALCSTGFSETFKESAKTLMQVPALRTKLEAEKEARYRPLRAQYAKTTGAQQKAIREEIRRVGKEETERADKELSQLLTKLSSSYKTYTTELRAKIFRTPSGTYKGATITGKGGTGKYVSCFQTYDKPGQPTVVVTVTLVGNQVVPANYKPYRDGIRALAWISDSKSSLSARAGAFDVHVSVHKKKLERDALNTLFESFVDLNTLRTLITVKPKPVVKKKRKAPGPMGQVVMEFYRLINVGNIEKAYGLTTEKYRARMARRNKNFWSLWLKEGLDLDEMYVKKERQDTETKGRVKILLAWKNSDSRPSKVVNLVKEDGKWKLN